MDDLFFDIETAPLPQDVLQPMLPELDVSEFEPMEFSESSVKLGNLKDEGKIRDKINAARNKHNATESGKSAARVRAIEAHWRSFYDKAALSAVTGRVLVIGYHSATKNISLVSHHDGDEAKVLQEFWKKSIRIRADHRRMVGLNIFDFDLPFLVRRSWMLGVDVPEGTFKTWNHRIQWPDYWLDLRPYWLLGQYGAGTKSNFDTLASAFGTAGKPQDGVTGANFHEQWHENREKATEYAISDVVQMATWVERMGL